MCYCQDGNIPVLINHDIHFKENMRNVIALACLFIALAGCGGGGNDTSPAVPTIFGSPGNTFSNGDDSPKQGARLEYRQDLNDNLNNTIQRVMTETVSVVNADGSFTIHEEDPSHDRTVSGKVDHSLYPTDILIEASGRESGYTIARPAGTVSCTFTAGDLIGVRTPKVGASWRDSYTLVCDGGPGLVYTRLTSVADVETVKVAAGVFETYKILTTVNYDNNGITHTESTTRWYNTDATGPHTIKQSVKYGYRGGTPPEGAVMSVDEELQSFR